MDLTTALAETYLTEFYDLHDLNARRIRLVGEVEQLAHDAEDPDAKQLLTGAAEDLALDNAGDRITRSFKYRAPSELAQIYRKDGLADARAILESLVAAEDQRPAPERSPCCYYNLAYVYHLMAHAAGIADKGAHELWDKALAVLPRARAVLKDRTDPGDGPDRCAYPSESRTLLALTHNLAAMIHFARAEDEPYKREIKLAFQYDAALPDASFTQSLYHMREHKFDAAILDLCKAVQAFLSRGEDIADVWFQMARVYHKKADRLTELGDPYADRLYDEARSCLQKATVVDPDFALPYFRLGLLELQRSECQQAIKFFERALRLDDCLFATLQNLKCPSTCCSGVRLKIMLLELLSKHKNQEEEEESSMAS